MKLSMFCVPYPAAGKEVMPKLKGRAIEVRDLVPALADVWQKKMVPGDMAHLCVLHGLQASCTIDTVLATYPDADILPPAAAREFEEACWAYCRAQNAAASHFNEGLGLMVFDVTIKTHCLLEGALRASHLNPRKSWNFSGEDFMAKGKQLLQSCVKGNTAPTSVVKLMEKYPVALSMVLREVGADLNAMD